MARKKNTHLQNGDGVNGTHDTAVAELPSESLPPVNEVRPELPPAAPAVPEKNRPVVTYRASSDRTTSISVSVWANTYTNQRGEPYEQLSVTVQRSYLDNQEQWQTQTKPSWRIHDLPVLAFLQQKAYDFAINRRTDDSTIPF